MQDRLGFENIAFEGEVMKFGVLGLLLIVASPAAAWVKTFTCSAEQGVGFRNQNNRYEQAEFEPLRFDARLYDLIDQSTKLRLEGRSRAFTAMSAFNCTKASKKTGKWICVSGLGQIFNLNEKNGRFVWALGYGYAFDQSDSVTVSIGRCRSTEN